MPRLLGRGPHVLTLPGLAVLGVRERVVRATATDDNRSRGLVAALELALQRAADLPLARAVAHTLPASEFFALPWAHHDAAPALAQRFDLARFVSAYAVSLGAAWDQQLEALCNQDEAPGAYFLGLVGGYYVDAAARALEGTLASDMAREGLVRTRRVRPGYAGMLPLETQNHLCALAGAELLGVRATPEGVLVPSKTVTGLVGWQPGPEQHGL